MEVPVYVASSFSKDNGGGNKAGVVFDGELLTTSEKMEIARQLGYSETAFISESTVADYKIGYFTPKEEVDLCGHATIASFVVLSHLNKISKKNYTIETNSGVLAITIKDEIIFMEQTKPIFSEMISPSYFENCFDTKDIDNKYPIQIVSTGLKDILIPIKSEEILSELKPDFEKIAEVSKTFNVVGMHLYTFADERIICRNFAPLYDINEESATGTSNAALASFLYHQSEAKNKFYTFEQGASLGALSEILVRLETSSNEEIEKVFVGGKGYYCEQKKLFL